MSDFSGLVGKTFESLYDSEPVTVFAAYIDVRGDVQLVVSKNGGPLHEHGITGIKPCS